MPLPHELLQHPSAAIERSFVTLRNRCNQNHLMVAALSNCYEQFLNFREQIDFSLLKGSKFRNIQQDFWVEEWSLISDVGPSSTTCLAFAQLQTPVTTGLGSGWNSEVPVLKYIYPLSGKNNECSLWVPKARVHVRRRWCCFQGAKPQDHKKTALASPGSMRKHEAVRGE